MCSVSTVDACFGLFVALIAATYIKFISDGETGRLPFHQSRSLLFLLLVLLLRLLLLYLQA